MQAYRARNPRKSPLWQCAHRHYDEFEHVYPDKYQPVTAACAPSFPRWSANFSVAATWPAVLPGWAATIAARNTCWPSPARAAGFVPPATRKMCNPPLDSSWTRCWLPLPTDTMSWRFRDAPALLSAPPALAQAA